MQSSTPEQNKQAGLSQWFIQQAEDELRRGDNLQASEKGWGAVAQAIKSIGEGRGWNHQGHRLRIDIAKQVADEQGRPDLFESFMAAQALHINFYEDWMAADSIETAIENVKRLVAELEAVRTGTPPQPFVIQTTEQRRRWERLTGDS